MNAEDVVYCWQLFESDVRNPREQDCLYRHLIAPPYTSTKSVLDMRSLGLGW